MSLEALQDARQAQPFLPFAIRMADGRSFQVDHPDFISVHPRGRSVFIFKPAGGYHLLDRALIAELDFKQGLPA